jgi:hypothetical protein
MVPLSRMSLQWSHQMNLMLIKNGGKGKGTFHKWSCQMIFNSSRKGKGKGTSFEWSRQEIYGKDLG